MFNNDDILTVDPTKEVKMKPETKLVQLNMRTHTLDQVADVKDRTNAESTTAAIRMSIEIADMVTKTLAAGGKVILDNGSDKQEIVMPNVSVK